MSRRMSPCRPGAAVIRRARRRVRITVRGQGRALAHESNILACINKTRQPSCPIDAASARPVRQTAGKGATFKNQSLYREAGRVNPRQLRFSTGRASALTPLPNAAAPISAGRFMTTKPACLPMTKGENTNTARAEPALSTDRPFRQFRVPDAPLTWGISCRDRRRALKFRLSQAQQGLAPSLPPAIRSRRTIRPDGQRDETWPTAGENSPTKRPPSRPRGRSS